MDSDPHCDHTAPVDWASLSVADRYRTSIGGDRSRPSTSAPQILAPLRRRLIISDMVLIGMALVAGLLLSARASTWAIDPVLAIYGTPAAIGVLWLLALGLRGSYDQRVIGLGVEELRKVLSATLYTFAVVAGVSYLFRADISRAYAFISLPLGFVLIVFGRLTWRSWLYRQRALGRFQSKTLVVGSGPAHTELIERLTADSFAGYKVVGEWPSPPSMSGVSESWYDGLAARIRSTQADAIALTPSDTFTSDAVRRLAWRLEGDRIDLLIAPTMLDVSGPRLSIRSTAGMPLLHIDEASLSRPQRFNKRVLDFGVGLLALVLLSPLMIVASLAVRLTSRGPVFFRQTRIGRGGEPFTVFKFRTMVQGADTHQEALRREHDLADPTFKLDADPRVTRVGRFLRRWSIDELPQLFNVLNGSMSLVGPRPHPLADVDRYELEAYRRLALKPGMTGLWQVAGRSNLPWQEALQMDLYYVESWSLSADLVILMRTGRAVLLGTGAR